MAIAWLGTGVVGFLTGFLTGVQISSQSPLSSMEARAGVCVAGVGVLAIVVDVGVLAGVSVSPQSSKNTIGQPSVLNGIVDAIDMSLATEVTDDLRLMLGWSRINVKMRRTTIQSCQEAIIV